MNRVVLDARGLLCPMPVIRVQERVQGLEAGTLVEALCSDPGALLDIPAWCRVNGHRVVETRSTEDEHVVVVRVGP